MEIAVCIATFRRPRGLKQLLESLGDQRGVTTTYGLIVVDNDPDGSAQPVVAEFSNSNLEIIYAVEPDPGIPAARNRTISLARSSGATAVAFIDDDEFASPYWLATMHGRLVSSGADAVSGPVEPIFPPCAPSWASRTRLYHRSTFPDGARLTYASTANSMLRLDAIASMKTPFNPEFRFSGGSDSLLFQTLTAVGKVILWEPNGLVYENVPAERLRMRWLISRSFRHGITLSRCDRLVHGSWLRLSLRAIKGLMQFPLGVRELVSGLLRRNDRWRNGLVRIARGAGTLAGLGGSVYEEYRRQG